MRNPFRKKKPDKDRVFIQFQGYGQVPFDLLHNTLPRVSEVLYVYSPSLPARAYEVTDVRHELDAINKEYLGNISRVNAGNIIIIAEPIEGK